MECRAAAVQQANSKR